MIWVMCLWRMLTISESGRSPPMVSLQQLLVQGRQAPKMDMDRELVLIGLGEL